jgi:hypothetical protein
MEAALDADVLVFCKGYIPEHVQLLRAAKAGGVRTIFDICDNNYPHPTIGPVCTAMSQEADRVVCNTGEMAKIASAFARSSPAVIDDPYEGPRGEPRAAVTVRNLLWFGHRANLDSLQLCLDDLFRFSKTRLLSLTLLTKLEPTDAEVTRRNNIRYAPNLSIEMKPWSLEAQWAELAACDAVIVPSRLTPRTITKSANRTIETLWAGRPAVAQPMPAISAFAAWTPIAPTIFEGLTALAADPEGAAARIGAAQAYIEHHNAPAVIGSLWADLIRATVARAT